MEATTTHTISVLFCLTSVLLFLPRHYSSWRKHYHRPDRSLRLRWQSQALWHAHAADIISVSQDQTQSNNVVMCCTWHIQIAKCPNVYRCISKHKQERILRMRNFQCELLLLWLFSIHSHSKCCTLLGGWHKREWGVCPSPTTTLLLQLNYLMVRKWMNTFEANPPDTSQSFTLQPYYWVQQLQIILQNSIR